APVTSDAETMAIRREAGNQEKAKNPASTTTSPGVESRMAPAARQAASTVSIAEVSDPVWDFASRDPAVEDPVVRIIVGLPAARRACIACTSAWPPVKDSR